MSNLKQQIVAELRQTPDPATVAKRLGISSQYVNRIWNEMPKDVRNRAPEPPPQVQAQSPLEGRELVSHPDQSPSPTVVPPNELLSPEDIMMQAIIPQNRDGIVGLRDGAINNLQDHLDDNSLAPSALLRLLGMILEHEAQLRAIARPAVSAISIDRSTTNIQQNLVARLGEMDDGVLRQLAGVPTSLPIIDGDIIK